MISLLLLGCTHVEPEQKAPALDPRVGPVPEWAERDPEAWQEFRQEKLDVLQLLERALHEKIPWTLYSLEQPTYPSLDSSPGAVQPKPVPKASMKKLDRFPIVADKQEERAAIQQELAEALAESVRNSDGTVSACFMPHHGIRFPFEEGPVDLLICFSCSSMRVIGDETVKGASITGDGFSAFYRIWNELELPQDYLKSKIQRSVP